jgi:hypothetical protein
MWKHKEDEKLSNILKEFVGQRKIKKGIDEFSIKKAWSETMSTSIQQYTSALYFAKDTLYLQISSASLRHELFAEREKLIKLLNEHLKADLIKKIVLK